jgi:hypothetical protein
VPGIPEDGCAPLARRVGGAESWTHGTVDCKESWLPKEVIRGYRQQRRHLTKKLRVVKENIMER